MSIFVQNDFSGGLDTQMDPAKSGNMSYPLMLNGRVRKNIVSPTNKHLELDAPKGIYQGLYIVGSFMVLFVSGRAWYAELTSDKIAFFPVRNWATMSTTALRIFCELVPATSNQFIRSGSPQNVALSFSDSIGVFPEALYCFDNVNQGQAIFPNKRAERLGTYANWTSKRPQYVPVGKLPAQCGSKLFLVAPDGKSIYQSVSGRSNDFVVNVIDADPIKGGDATTTSTTVSFNEITAMRSLSTGSLLVGTLYSTHEVELDATRPVFGEPYLQPVTLFPSGIINELSIIDILDDTAFITQSGIHAFNVVAQAKRESNNFAFGAKIRGLITDLDNDKSIIQKDTCAGLYNDYAFFAVQTIFGFGAIVYDTISKIFHALDLGFGPVKQFATTRLSGQERMFYITHENKLFEAFASEEVASTRIYLGEFTPTSADQDVLADVINLQFTNMRSAGQLKISVFADKEFKESFTVNVDAEGFVENIPISIPFPSSKQGASVSFQLSNSTASWRLGMLLEWNFNGALSDMSIDGTIRTQDNLALNVPVEGKIERYVFLADSGYPSELNPGGSFPGEGFVVVNVVKGEKYAYVANGNGSLANGNLILNEGVFTALSNQVVITGTGAMTFSLRLGTNYINVVNAVVAEGADAVWHGGDFAYEVASLMDVKISLLPWKTNKFLPVVGNHDIITSSGLYFYAGLKTARYYSKEYGLVGVFVYNGNHSEPDGYDENSIQAQHLRNWIASSPAKYKLILCHFPMYTNDSNHSPGDPSLRFMETLGVSAVIAGHAHKMERYYVKGFPSFVCGAGGHTLRGYTATPQNTPAFTDNTHYGYLLVEADDLTCTLSFKSVEGVVLDTYAIYS